MTPKHTNKYIFIIMGLLILFVVYLQFTIDESTENLRQEEIKKSEQYAEKIAKYIKGETDGSLVQYLEEHTEKRGTLNKILHTFLTEQFQYIFLLHKDQKGHYRFLLDGSLEDPVEYNTIFFPKSKRFNSVYSTQKSQIIKKSEGVEQIWLSLLYPIVEQGQTQALLVIDLSQSHAEHLSSFNSPVMQLVRWMQLFLVISFFFLLYLFYSFYKLRKSILIDPITSTYTKIYLQEFFDTRKVNQYNAMLIDIDELRRVNTKYGHKSGDTVLKMFAQEMSTLLPKNSYLVRGKGSEFFVIVAKESANLEELAKKVF